MEGVQPPNTFKDGFSSKQHRVRTNKNGPLINRAKLARMAATDVQKFLVRLTSTLIHRCPKSLSAAGAPQSDAQGQARRVQAAALEGDAPEVEGHRAARLVPSSESFSDVCARFPSHSFDLVARHCCLARSPDCLRPLLILRRLG